MLKKIFIIFTIIFIHEICFCQSSGGGYAESYLHRDIGARGIALAGAYTAISNEPSAIYYNPAGIGGFGDNPFFATMFSFLQFDRTHSSLSYGQSISENLSIAAGIDNFTSGKIIGRDVKGNLKGNYTDWAFSITGAAAYHYDFANIGLAVKYIRNALTNDGISANGYSFDVGMKFDIADLFTFGASIQNFINKMHWSGSSGINEKIPLTIRTGLAIEFGLNEEEYTTRATITGELETLYIPATHYILLDLDYTFTQFEKSPKLLLGCEAVFYEWFALRGGIVIYGENLGIPQLLPMNKWGVGLSLKPEIEGIHFKTNIDYSLSNDYLAVNNLSHHISLLFEF